MNEKEFICVENLKKSFCLGTTSINVLQGINFFIKKGEMVGVVGTSGVGKSTLLHILGTLDRPTNGKVYFQGKDIFCLKDNKLAEFRNQEVGFVFQSNQLLPEFTALENTAMPAWIRRQKKEEVLSKANYLLNEVGLKKRLNHKPGELSGGEQQRVSIARALMNDPAILLADEPTGNLDAKTSEAIYQLFRKFNREMGQTFIIVTHNDKLIKDMDRIVKIADGKIEESVEPVLSRSKRY